MVPEDSGRQGLGKITILSSHMVIAMRDLSDDSRGWNTTGQPVSLGQRGIGISDTSGFNRVPTREHCCRGSGTRTSEGTCVEADNPKNPWRWSPSASDWVGQCCLGRGITDSSGVDWLQDEVGVDSFAGGTNPLVVFVLMGKRASWSFGCFLISDNGS